MVGGQSPEEVRCLGVVSTVVGRLSRRLLTPTVPNSGSGDPSSPPSSVCLVPLSRVDPCGVGFESFQGTSILCVLAVDTMLRWTQYSDYLRFKDFAPDVPVTDTDKVPKVGHDPSRTCVHSVTEVVVVDGYVGRRTPQK